MRWALEIEYDGAGFAGWQKQAGLPTIAGALEAAAGRLGDAPALAVAGRTDAGVHAEAQVALLELPGLELPPARLRDALNFHLRPHRIAVRRAAIAPEGWHPRFSATGRRYRYRILDRRARPALEEGRVWHVPRPLDVPAMQEAARHLLGRHDFTSFRAAACQSSGPIRTLDRLDVAREGEQVAVRAEARSFLHHQVRNMVGTLRLVGDGRLAPAALAGILARRDRAAAGPTAPPDGLCLTGVSFDADPFAA